MNEMGGQSLARTTIDCQEQTNGVMIHVLLRGFEVYVVFRLSMRGVCMVE